jgi:hypothetical protein
MRNISVLFAAIAFVLQVASVAYGAIPPGYTGKPYKGDTLLGRPQQIPGVVKGVFVDSGGEALSVHSCCAVQGYADWDYDIVGAGTNGLKDSSVNAAHPTSHLSYMVAGQWMKYTVHVNVAGVYYVDFKLATVGYPNLQTLTYYDGSKVTTGSVKNLPVCQTPPGCPEPWHAWNYNLAVDSVALDTGLQVVQITFDQGSWNYDWMRFRLKGGTGIRAPFTSGPEARPLNLRAFITGSRLEIVHARSLAAPSRISLVDCAGRAVLSKIDNGKSATDRAVTLDVQTLPQGIYYVNVECRGVRETRAVTIVR